MFYSACRAWLTALGLAVLLAVAWVLIGMAVVVLHPDPLLLITALVCLGAAGGIEFSKDEGDMQ